MTSLTEVDSLEILVVIDNELDPISTYQNPGLTAEGNMMHIAFANPEPAVGRGPSTKELKMDNICCSAHGLSLMITARKGDVSHTLMFDGGLRRAPGSGMLRVSVPTFRRSNSSSSPTGIGIILAGC